jgi:hypothetical protein
MKNMSGFPGPPRYDIGELTTQSRRSMPNVEITCRISGSHSGENEDGLSPP